MQAAPPVTAHPFRIRRVAAIDGLRGLAVGSVVLYHYFGNLMPGGYLGVDIFFVLSGFLITSLLIRERYATGRVDLKQFWLRRVRRILPAAVFVLVIGTALAGLVRGDAAVGLPTQFFGTLFFVNNWTQIASSQSYFADQGVQLFAHYWSLAVEEQFYVLWPLIFVGLLAAGVHFKQLRWVCLGLALASFAWMVVLYNPEVDPTRVYYGTDTHAFGLLVGAALACAITTNARNPEIDSWPVDPNTGIKDISLWNRKQSAAQGTTQGAGLANTSAASLIAPGLALAALALLVLLLFTMADTAPITYRGGLIFASALTAMVLYAVVAGIQPITSIFNTAALRWLGKVSFSLYLWHWPVVVLLTELASHIGDGHHSFIVGVLSLVIAVPLSAWSYAHIETPIRRDGYRKVFNRWREEFQQRKALIAAAVVVVVLLTVVALVTSPSQTRLERDLAELAIQQEEAARQQQAEEAAKTAPGLAPPEARKMPEGTDITAIGDSVMLASLDALQQEFPGIYVDAAVSSHYKDAVVTIQQMKAEGTLDPFVVLGYGTNGPSDGAGEEVLSQILAELGEERVVILNLPYGDRWYMPDAEAEVLEAARTHSNVYVADWCHAVRDNLELLRGDLVHPEPPGALAYAREVRNALTQWVDNSKTVPGQCGVR